MAKQLKIHSKDPIIHRVIKKIDNRSAVGFKKYGVTLEDDDVDIQKWLTHLQEELMDAVNYIEKLKASASTVLEDRLVQKYEIEDAHESYWKQDESHPISKHP